MNPLKCAFGVTSGKFLGFVVRHRGIEIDQTKIKAINEMSEPKTLKELRGLQGHLAYIRRFISNLAGRCQPFSHLMKKDAPFQWDEKGKNAFDSIKKYLASAPVLGAPIPGKPLVLYIAKTRTLHGGNAVKGQAIADFFADHPVPAEWEISDDLPGEEIFYVDVLPPWQMYFDGATRHFSLNQLDDIHVGHVPRSANKLADALANLAATLALGAEESMKVTVCNRWVVSSLEGEENVDTTNMICVYTADEDDWRQPIIDFLDHQKLPDDPRHKVEIRRCAPKFIHYKGTLYRRSFSGQWLRCLSKDEATEAMHETHSGICGDHQSGPKLHDRVKRMGYYWPTMVQD
ncbi:uncharacterized protein LOC141632598 [Silene latifolia]|uniref:uncharacterized protein LOC141632598 n=1 Tax=Silene latifolia TaxID=37657 RepID=UPI003D77A455